MSRYYIAMKSSASEHTAALIERVGRLLHTETHAEGLLPVQWEALRYLQRANRFSTTAAALTAYLGLTKGTVSQTLKALESRGLVRKRVNARDRRSKHLSVTAKGRKLLGHDPLTATVAVLDDLSSRTRSALDTGLETLLSARLAAQDRQPFGQCQDCRYFARRHPDGDPHYCQLLKEPLAESEADAICFEQTPG